MEIFLIENTMLKTAHKDKCYEEVEKCFSENGKFVVDQCPYLNAVLLENFRFRPVVDTLPHLCIENTELEGYLIKKGSVVIASLTAVMYNPQNFPEPESFKPERFLADGKYQKNPLVCPFSVGLRSCLGKRLAEIEYFTFAAQIIHKFKISSNEPIDLEPVLNNFLLTPPETKLVFTHR